MNNLGQDLARFFVFFSIAAVPLILILIGGFSLILLLWSRAVVNSKMLVFISDQSRHVVPHLVPRETDILFEGPDGVPKKYLYNETKIRFLPFPTNFVPKWLKTPIPFIEFQFNNPEPIDVYSGKPIISAESLAIVQDESFLRSLVNTMQEIIGGVKAFTLKSWMMWSVIIMNLSILLLVIGLAVFIMTGSEVKDLRAIKDALGIGTP